jgi:hypothetical protein
VFRGGPVPNLLSAYMRIAGRLYASTTLKTLINNIISDSAGYEVRKRGEKNG